MKIAYGDLIQIQQGIICQQVNCMNEYGAGLSGELARKWPEIEQDYRESFTDQTGTELFGSYRVIDLGNGLWCANIYSQYECGNAYLTDRVYTDMYKLVTCLTDICKQAERMDLQVYIPKNIGCGLAGGNWNDLCQKIQDLPIIAISLEKDDNEEKEIR